MEAQNTKSIPKATRLRKAKLLSSFSKNRTTGTLFFPECKGRKPSFVVPSKVKIAHIEELLENLENSNFNTSSIKDFADNVSPAKTPNKPHQIRGFQDPQILQNFIKYSNDLLDIATNPTYCGSKVLPNENMIMEYENKVFLSRYLNSLRKFLQPEESEVNTISKLYKRCSKNKAFHQQSQTKDTVISLHKQGGLSFSNIASIVGTSKSTVARTIKRSQIPAPIISAVPKINEITLRAIVDFLKQRQGIVSARQIKDFLKHSLQTDLSVTSIYNIMKEILLLRKKRISKVILRRNPVADLQAKFWVVNQFLNLVSQHYLPVVIDECGITVDTEKHYIWWKKGFQPPMVTSRPFSRLSVISGICFTGLSFLEVHQGATNSITFLSFLGDVCVQLQKIGTETHSKFFIFMDNCVLHRCCYAKATIAKFGLPCLYNSPYSCYLNPIEFIFQACKLHLRSLGTLSVSSALTQVCDFYSNLDPRSVARFFLPTLKYYVKALTFDDI